MSKRKPKPELLYLEVSGSHVVELYRSEGKYYELRVQGKSTETGETVTLGIQLIDPTVHVESMTQASRRL